MRAGIRLVGIMTLGALAAAAASMGAATAQEGGRLMTNLSDHLVAVRSDFTGAEILLFGVALESDGVYEHDVIVVVRGPESPLRVRRKARVAGVWVNYDSVIFDDVPGYYAVASTRPLGIIGSHGVFQRHGIGMDYVELGGALAAGGRRIDPQERALYRAALIRGKMAESLYREEPGAVTFVDDALFRTTFHLPAGVPDGNYVAEVYVLHDGHVVDAQTSPLYVDKTGFGRFVFRLAQDDPLVYGIAAVCLALLSGWLASVLFRRP